MVEKPSMKIPICSYFLKGPKALTKKAPSKLCQEGVLIILMGCLIYGCEIQVVDGTGNSTGLSFSLDPKSYDMASNHRNPTFKVKGFTKVHGNLQLFNDHECTITASNSKEVTRSSETITSSNVNKLETKFWVQYTDPDNMLGNCIGPIVYKINDDLTLLVSSGSRGLDLTPTFNIRSSFRAEGGSVQLFSDSKCSSAVSNAMDMDTSSRRITTYQLDYQPSYDFYVKRIYDNGKEKCIGPTIYNITERIIFSYDSSSVGGFLTPSFIASGLYEGGSIQLFSDYRCITAASNVVKIDNNTSTQSITVTPLDAHGSHHFYLKRIIHNGSNHCIGPVEYNIQPGFEPDPSEKYKASFIARNLIEGTSIQLFTDSNCTNKASEPLVVDKTSTLKIMTTHMHTLTNSFYLKLNSSDGITNSCIGPVKSSRLNFFISKDCNAQNVPDFEKPIYLAWCNELMNYQHIREVYTQHHERGYWVYRKQKHPYLLINVTTSSQCEVGDATDRAKLRIPLFYNRGVTVAILYTSDSKVRRLSSCETVRKLKLLPWHIKRCDNDMYSVGPLDYVSYEVKHTIQTESGQMDEVSEETTKPGITCESTGNVAR